MVELGSDASAACGGLSELSAWQRSARDDGGNAEDIRRAPQQEDPQFFPRKTEYADMMELVDV